MTVLDASVIELSVRGDVPDVDRDYAKGKLCAAAKPAPRPILAARLRLVVESDPARSNPASAQASLDIAGHVVRAHAEARTMREATDLLEDRLREQIGRLAKKPATVARRERSHTPAGDTLPR